LLEDRDSPPDDRDESPLVKGNFRPPDIADFHD
jgi:hypothetical protein